MRRTFEVIVMTAVLLGCSDRQWVSPTAPIQNSSSTPGRIAQSLSGVEGQEISATVSGQDVIASTNFAGVISAQANKGCVVSPSLQEATATPGAGGMKTATFHIVFPSCVGSCLVTVTDKKGNSASVTPSNPVNDGSCFS